MELLLFWFIMAVICGMVASSKKGAGVGFLFFLYGLIIWPIALVHAFLVRTRKVKEEPVRAEGLVNGKPYWRTLDGKFCAMIDGKEVAFPTINMLSTALGGGEVVEATIDDDELIGKRLLRRLKII